MTQRIIRWLPIAGLVLAVAGGYHTWQRLRAGPVPALPPQGSLSATVVDDEMVLPAFEAVRAEGRFGNEQLRGHWNLLFFGYTHCPDICPTTLTLLKQMHGRLASRDLPLPQVVLLSVDPARDTPQGLKQYVGHFDAAFIGATGTDEGLGPLMKHLGARYARHDGDKAGGYAIDHTAAIYLVDTTGRLRAVFSPPFEPARMADDYAVLIR